MVNWLGFLFEYLFGVSMQLYVLLLAYCWVRGLSFRPRQLLDFAIRRSAFVLQWAAVVMLLSTLFIDLPLMLQNVPWFARWQPADAAELERRTVIARLALDLVFLAWCSVQVILTLHNECLVRSLRDHLSFVRHHGWPVGWLILLALLHFYILHFVHHLCLRGFGEGTALWVAWSLAFPWLAGCSARGCSRAGSPCSSGWMPGVWRIGTG